MQAAEKDLKQFHVEGISDQVHGAQAHIADAIEKIKIALDHMPVSANGQAIPAISNISRYVEQLLAPDEQHICDRATD